MLSSFVLSSFVLSSRVLSSLMLSSRVLSSLVLSSRVLSSLVLSSRVLSSLLHPCGHYDLTLRFKLIAIVLLNEHPTVMILCLLVIGMPCYG